MRVMDKAQRDLDAASAKYRRAYNRGYGLSERGDYEAAQKILDKANREYDVAKARFALKNAVSGAIERGEAEAIWEVTT